MVTVPSALTSRQLRAWGRVALAFLEAPPIAGLPWALMKGVPVDGPSLYYFFFNPLTVSGYILAMVLGIPTFIVMK